MSHIEIFIYDCLNFREQSLRVKGTLELRIPTNCLHPRFAKWLRIRFLGQRYNKSARFRPNVQSASQLQLLLVSIPDLQMDFPQVPRIFVVDHHLQHDRCCRVWCETIVDSVEGTLVLPHPSFVWNATGDPGGPHRRPSSNTATKTRRMSTLPVS